MHPVTTQRHPRTDDDDPRPSGGTALGCVIVLSGTVASGKSTVSRELERLGATVLDADRVAHGVLDRPGVRARLREAFGEAIFTADGSVDRKALGAVVFDDPEALARLEGIVHPDTFAELARGVADARAAGRAVVIDIPLLHQAAHLEEVADLVVFVDAPLEVRRARTVRDRGWPEGELERRESRQRPATEARAAAHVVVENTGSPEEVARKAEALWRERVLPRLAPGSDGAKESEER